MKSAQSFAAPRKMSASALLLLGLVLAFGCTQPLPQKAQFAQVDVVTANDVPQPGADADATGVDAAPDTAQPDTLGADSPDTVDAADTIDAEPDAGADAEDAADVADDADALDAQDDVLPDTLDDAIPDALPLDATAAEDAQNTSDVGEDLPPADVPIVGNLSFLQGPTDTMAGALIGADPTTPMPIQVALVDDGGLTLDQAKADVTLEIASGPDGAKLSGTTKVPTVGGVATFDAVSLDKAGSYTLVATALGYGKYTSDSFTITAGKASRLAFAVQPVTTSAGVPVNPAVVVAVQDAFGNPVADATPTIALGIGTGPSGAKLTGTTSADAVAGVATFDDLVLTKASAAYTLVAFSMDLKGATSAEFAVLPGAPAALGFLTQPSDIVAGAPFNPAVKVLLKDAYGNKISTGTSAVTMSIGAGPGGAKLLGSATVDAVGGVAVFADLAVDKAGTGYTIIASSSGYNNVTSPPFQVKVGSASALAFTVQPSATQAGVATTAQVTVTDAWGNKVATGTQSVELALADNPGNATLSGTTTVTAKAGVASFTDIRLDKSSTGYRLKASATGLTDGASDPFDVTFAKAVQLVVTGQPQDTVAGVPMAPAVTLEVQDEFGNLVADDSSLITVSLATNAGGATLGGQTGVVAVNGKVALSDLILDRTGVGYTFSLAAQGLTGALTAPFAVLPSMPAKLVFVTQPTASVAGATLQPAVQVAIQDAYGNKVAANLDVTLALGANQAGASLAGTTTVTAKEGLASFADLHVDRAGKGFTLLASSPDLAGATSATFDVTFAAAARLAFEVQPAGGLAGTLLDPPVAVRIEDAFGNTVTTASDLVSIKLAQNPGGGALSGTTNVKALAGIALFSDLQIDKAGKGYVMQAEAVGLLAKQSNTFDIGSGTPTQLRITVQPTDVKAGAPMAPAVKVAVLDATGNAVASATTQVTLAIGSNPGSAKLVGQVSATAVAGIATFDGVRLDRADSGYTLVVSAPGLTSDTSIPFTVSHGAAAGLAFVLQPSDTTAGQPLQSVRVAVQDAYGNAVLDATQPVSLSLAPTADGAALGGTQTVPALAGNADFADLTVAKAGTGFSLKAQAAGLQSAVSTTFAVHPGAAARLVFAQQPSSSVAGTPMAPAVQVQVQDAFGNATVTADQQITLALGVNPGGAALLGSATMPTVLGKATFADIAVDKVGSGYTLLASSGGLQGAESQPFDVSYTLPTALAIATEPTATVAGVAMAPALVVHVVDGFGNVVQGASVNVTIALQSNPGSGKLLGTSTVAALDGVATFADVRLDKAAVGYTLVASASNLTDATTKPFDVLAGQRKHLAIAQQPGSGVAGQTLSPGVAVDIQDAFGNAVHDANDAVQLTLLPAGSGVVLGGTPQQAALNGRATFDDLHIDKTGVYTLRASASGLTNATTTDIAIQAGSPFALAFVVQPSAVAAGSAMQPAVKVVVLDASGNLVGTATNTVALQLADNPAGGALLGNSAAAAVAGTATFTDIRLDKAGSGYSLTAIADGLVSATSTAFGVTAGAGHQLVFLSQPSAAVAGAFLNPKVQIGVVDAYGNAVTGEAHNVQLGVVQGPPGGALSGTAAIDMAAGIAVFADASLHRSGTGYVLGATSPGLLDAASAPFAVTFAAAAKLGFVTQPADGVVGVPVNPAVQVAVQDAFGNTVTTASADITLSLSAQTPGTKLTGTLVRPTDLGVATFADLQLDKIGAGFALLAAANDLTGATSTPFAMAAAGNLRLSFTTQPASGVAGTALATIEVTVLDSLDNIDPTATAPITIAISNNSGNATLSGTKTVIPSGGKATFTALSLDKTGTNYTLLATQAGTTAGVSASFDITAGAPAQLTFLTQPTSATAGVTLSPAVRVAVTDALGNVIPTATDNVTVTLAPAAAGATLSGATTTAASNGIAQFGGLSVDKAGSNYTLVAKAAGLTTAISTVFPVVPGAASQLSFTAQPTGTTAGVAIAPAVQVVVQDAFGNTVTGATPPVVLAVGNGPSGAVLTGTTTVSTTSGTATFSNLVLTRMGSGYTLQASAGGLQGDTSDAFDVVPAAAAQLAFLVQPSATAAGASIAPAMQVAVQDAFGNTVPTATTIGLELSTNPSSATLLSGISAATSQGIATFATTALDKAGSGFVLKASASGVSATTSSPFNVTPGTATRLAFSVQPSSAQAGAAMSPAVKVFVQDDWGNLVTSGAPMITLAVATNSFGSSLLTGASTTAVSGVATFGNVSVDRVGTGLQLTAAGSSLAGATSATFDISAAAPARLAFVAQPGTSQAGAAISPTVQVAIQDNWGNTVPSAGAQVSLAIANNAGGGALSGTLTAAASGGIASFANLHLDKAASGYTLGATSGSLTGATSAAFDITFAAAARLAFSVQPANAVAGASITPAVKVAVQDAFGNLVTNATNSVVIGLGANPGGSVLSASANAAGGIATFSDLSLAKAANGYTLAATSSSLTGATSSTFNVTFGAPDHLAFTVQPSDGTAGAALTPVVKVSVLDANGNLVGTAATAVTIELSENPGGSTFTAVTSNAVAGIASFANLSLDKVGSGYGLSASAAGLTPATSSHFAISAGAASKLAFTVQPISGTAGSPLAALQVSVQDAFGNLVPTATPSISLSLSTNPGGATLLTGGAATAAGGVATFNNLSLDKVATGYRLGAAATGLTPATSDVFAITAGTAVKLGFLTQPSDVAAGTAMTSFKIAVQDTWGNTVTTASGTMTLAISTNPSGGKLLAGATASAVSGVASFDSVQLDKVGSGYKLTATASAWTSPASNAFSVSAGSATKLAFSVQPTDVVAGSTMTAVKVVVQDAYGNLVPTASQLITLGMANNPGGASVLTGATATASGGTATFGSLTFDKAGSGYTLSATGPSLTGDTSTAFAITAGAAQKLGFAVQPSDVAAGKSMALVKVAVQDTYGNTVPTGTQAVHLSFAVNPAGATILTGADATAAAGLASFGAISLDKAGSGFKFSASTNGLTSATSNTFSVTGGDATKLVFAVQPVTGAAGATLAGVDVAVHDAWDNPVTTATPSITLALSSGTLLGTNPVAAAAGVAHFGDLHINKVGSGYTLTATTPGLSGATSTAFDITPGAPAALSFTVQPVTATAGVAMAPSVKVTVLDAYANVATSATNSVTLAIGTNPSGGALLDPQTVAAVGGVATFDGIRLDKVGSGYTLTAGSSGLLGTTSATFSVTFGTATQLAFASQPSTTVAGVNIANFAVNVLDAYGNLVGNASNSVTLGLATNPGGATLLGASTVNASNGVALFSAVKIQKAATGYQLSASATNLTSGQSATFDITNAAAAQLAFTKQPTNTAAGVALSPAVEVTVQDAFGNKVGNATSEITVGIGTNPGGGTLSGVATKSAVAGVDSYADLSINKTGNGYTLTASSGSLTAATSSAFNVTPNTSLRLVFTTQPATPTTAGVALGSVTVTVQDSLGNPVLLSNAAITIAIGTNPGSATLSGTKTVNASLGSATFSDLSLNKSASGYTLSATSAGMTSGVSSPFTINAAAAAKLLFLNAPASSVSAGANVLTSGASALQVAVADSFDNTVPSATNSIALALDTNTYGGTLGGTVTASATNGIASFSASTVAKAGLAYRLAATTSGLTGAFSSNFDVVASAPAKIAYNVQPSKTTAGVAMAPAVKVDIQDAYGNLVTGATNVVTLAVQTGPSGAVLTGGSAAASGGTAVFSNVTLDKAGSYTLAAASTSLTGTTSSSFTIDPGTATALAVSTQPSTAASGVAMSPPMVLTVQDNFGNTVTTSTASVALAITSGPGTLTSGATVSAVAGVATFSNLKLDKAGTYRLQATSAGLATISTNLFNVTPGTATKLVFKTQPSSAPAGSPLGTPAVEIRDAADNLCDSLTSSVTLATTTGTGSGVLQGTKTVAASGGVASFPAVNLTVTGAAYKLTASSGSLTTADSAAFAVTPANPYALSYAQAPTNGTAGVALSPAVAVNVLDQWGNIVTNAGGSVSISVLTPAGNPLTGGGGTAPSSGVATFSNLVLTKAASYTLRANYGAISVDSAAFTVAPAAASAAHCTLTPSVGSTTADGTASIGFTALIRDAYDNPLAGQTIVLASTGTANTLTQFGKTDSTGSASASMTSTKAEAKTVSVLLGGVTMASTSVTYTAGTPSAAHCSLSPSVASTTANGTASITFTATLRDVNDNPVPGQTVSLSSTGTGNTLTQPVSATAADGTTTGSMTSTKAEAKTVTALVGLTQLANTSVTYVAGAPDSTHSLLSVSPASVAAGSSSFVTVTARDVNDNPVSGLTVVFSCTGTGNTITQPSGTTSSVGTANGSVNSTKAESKTFTATIGGVATVNLPYTVLPAAIDGTHSTVSASPSTATANGATAITFTVTVRDVYDNPISGVGVTLASTGTGNTITQPVGSTSSAGVVTGSMTSTKAETKTVSATSGSSAAGSTNVGFKAGAAAAGHCTLTPSMSSQTANGTIVYTATVRDAFDNPVANVTVTLASTGSANTYTQPSAATDSTGVTSGWIVSTKAEAKVVSLMIGGAAFATANVTYTAGAASQIVWGVQPGNIIAGNAFSPAPTVEIHDAWDNLCTTAANSVTIWRPNGTGAMTGTLTASAVYGVATFSGVSVTAAGTNDQLGAMSTGFSNNYSAFFNVSAATAKGLAWAQQPISTTAGGILTPNVAAMIVDNYGNKVSTATDSISLTVKSGPANSLTGGGAVTTSSGTATWSAYFLRTGTYVLSATGTTYGTISSSSFVISPLNPYPGNCTFSVTPTQPAGMVAASPTMNNTVTATLYDYYGNPVPNQTVTFSSSEQVDFFGTAAATDKNGASAVGMGSTKAGARTVSVKDANGNLLVSGTVSFVNSGTSAANSSFSVTPGVQYADGSSTVTMVVTVLDQFGNPVQDTVTFAVTGSGNTYGSSGTSGADGKYSATLSSTKNEVKAITANVGSDVNGNPLATMISSVTFVAAQPVLTSVSATMFACASVSYTAKQLQTLPIDLLVEFSTDATTFKRCTQATVGNAGISGVTASVAGMPHTFGWNTTYDLPHYTGQVILRLTPSTSSGAVVGNAVTTTAWVYNGLMMGSPVNYPSGGSPVGARGIAYGDMNGDGINDVVTANYTTGTVSVFLGGTGATTLTLKGAYTEGSGPNAIVMADFNKDGKQDVAVTDQNSGGIGVMLGDGTGALGTVTRYSATVVYIGGLAAGDLDNDGDIDLVASETNPSPGSPGYFVCTNGGTGTFTCGSPVATPTLGWTVALGDLNRDGKLDLVIDNSDTTIQVALGSGSGTFGTPSSFAGTTNHNYVVIRDVNRDGKLDVLAPGDNYVDVWKGNGDGTLGTVSSWYSGATNQRGLGIGDMNGDGILDIATAGYWNNTVSLGMGNGDGTFQSSGTVTVGSVAQPQPFGIAIVDVNADGRLDLVAANQLGINTTVRLNNAAAPCERQLSGTIETPVGTGPSSAVMADFNGDGKPDAAVTNNAGGSFSVLLGSGSGGFATPVTYTLTSPKQPTAIAAADIDADGDQDLIVTQAPSGGAADLLTYTNNGSGTFTLAATLALGTVTILDMAVGNINNDGKPDFVVLTPNSLIVYKTNSAGVVVWYTTYVMGSVAAAQHLTVGDINGDGWSDVAVANNASIGGAIYINNQAGSFTELLPSAGIGASRAVATLDANSDGKLDLVFAQPNAIRVLLNSGSGTWDTGTAYSAGLTGTVGYALAVGDFNGDGIKDVAEGGYNATATGGHVVIFAGNGDSGGSFVSPPPAYYTPRLPSQLVTADTNGDGRLDIGVVNNFSDTFGMLLSSGTTAMRAGTQLVATGAYGLVAADFNSDGRLDFAATNAIASGAVNIFLASGSSYATAVAYTVGSTPTAASAIDWNKDGKLDLFVANSGGGYTIYSGDGTGAFSLVGSWWGNAFWDVATGDFNLDGKPDMALSNDYTTGSYDYLSISSSTGALADGNLSSVPLAVNYQPRGVAVADFNADGRPDVAVANLVGVVTVATNGVTAWTTTNYTCGSSNLIYVAAGDVSGDGKPDIVATNNITGGPYGVFILTNTGTSFTVGTQIIVNKAPTGVKLADMNGDGKLDIVLTGSYGYLSVGWNNGGNSFTWSHFGGIGGMAYGLQIGDFDRDGLLDAATATNGSNKLSILTGR